MSLTVAHDLNDADERILQLLGEGRNSPQNLAEELDYSRQYVQNRLQLLKAADLVENMGGGLYRITTDGRDEVGIVEPDVDDLRRRLQNALEARDDQRARADRLEDELADCRDQLERAREQEVDVEAVDRALDDIETAADRGNGDSLQDAIRRAREAIGYGE